MSTWAIRRGPRGPPPRPPPGSDCAGGAGGSATSEGTRRPLRYLPTSDCAGEAGPRTRRSSGWSRTGTVLCGQADLASDRSERLDDEGDVLIEVHVQLGRSAVDVVPVDGTGEGFVLELLADGGHLHPGD